MRWDWISSKRLLCLLLKDYWCGLWLLITALRNHNNKHTQKGVFKVNKTEILVNHQTVRQAKNTKKNKILNVIIHSSATGKGSMCWTFLYRKDQKMKKRKKNLFISLWIMEKKNIYTMKRHLNKWKFFEFVGRNKNLFMKNFSRQ